jgi:hypothetical protein
LALSALLQRAALASNKAIISNTLCLSPGSWPRRYSLGASRGFGSKEACARIKMAFFSLKHLPLVGLICSAGFVTQEFPQGFHEPFIHII